MRQAERTLRLVLVSVAGVLLCCLALAYAPTTPSPPPPTLPTTIDIDRAIKAVSIDESGYAYECFTEVPASLPYGCELDPRATYDYFQGAWRKR